MLAFVDLVQSAPEKWNDSKNVSVAFRLVLEKEGIKGNPTKGIALTSLFCSASRLRPEVLKRAMEIIMENSNFISATNYIRTSDEFSSDIESKDTLGNIFQYTPKCSNVGTTDKTNYYTINGRMYAPIEGPSGPFLTIDDVKMLINIELDKTIGMTKLIAPKLLPKDGSEPNKEKTLAIHNAIALSQTALNHAFSKAETSSLSKYSQKASSAIVEVMESVGSSEEKNPLYFSWNEDAKEKLQVSMCLIQIYFVS
jgi:hypothetical protein